jgi:hypothetical protein
LVLSLFDGLLIIPVLDKWKGGVSDGSYRFCCEISQVTCKWKTWQVPGIDLFFFSFFSLFPSLLFVLSLCFYLFIYLFILIMDRIFFLLPNHIGTCSFLLDKYNSNGREREGQSHRTNQSQLVKMSKSKNSGCI